MSAFSCRGLSLLEAIDALKAHDAGAWDSGIGDEALREAVITHLNGLSSDERRRILAECARSYLTDEAIASGYGLEDVLSLAQWFETLGIHVER